MALLEFTDKGIYCPQANVYIDPWKPVSRALITHGHADHARWGNKYYLCTHQAKPVIQYRLGNGPRIESVAYGEERTINGVQISFHPAGHIVGSAQIRLEYQGEVWVVSGDYKTEHDGIATPFEPVKCNVFITESTFGLPVFRWKPQREVMQEINDWWRGNAKEGKTSIMMAYSLGKAQRILKYLDTRIGKIFTHGAVESVNKVLQSQGLKLPPAPKATIDNLRNGMESSFVIAPPSAVNSNWVHRFKEYSTGFASGWMAMNGTRSRRSADRGFMLSDHADWDGLNEAVLATGAEKVYVMHGYTSQFAKWLNEQGIWAAEMGSEYHGEQSEETHTE
ncbi:MAG: ligase-associated DNA damage response exonuclease [Saprospirales bacterium]|nr:ligase-associated DNA damage response exonuclease [Saprospirales bacterium]MBK8493160.1 ligase-associated DNA damage response exonuclease [Saprospirales bacterium]